MTAPLTTAAEAFGGSVIGREHARVGRNNQDGWCLRRRGGRTVAVVTDGCGSQPGSEVGAQLGAQCLASFLASQPLSAALPVLAMDALVDALGAVARRLEPEGGAEARALVERAFLFTVLAAVVEGGRALVFGQGDGLVWVDGALTRLTSGEANAPDYCGYGLFGGGGRPTVHYEGPAARVALATDGLEGLSARRPGALGELLEGVEGWRNPLTLQRRLNVLATAERLADDATMVAVCQPMPSVGGEVA